MELFDSKFPYDKVGTRINNNLPTIDGAIKKAINAVQDDGGWGYGYCIDCGARHFTFDFPELYDDGQCTCIECNVKSVYISNTLVGICIKNNILSDVEIPDSLKSKIPMLQWSNH